MKIAPTLTVVLLLTLAVGCSSGTTSDGEPEPSSTAGASTAVGELPLGPGAPSEPRLLDDLIVVPGADGVIAAAPGIATPEWTNDDCQPAAWIGTFTVGDGLFVWCDQVAAGLDAASGRLLWDYRVSADTVRSSSTAIAFGSGQDLTVISAADGTEEWSFSPGFRPFDLDTGSLYMGSSGRVRAYRLDDGEEQWSTRIQSDWTTSFVSLDLGGLYAISEDNRYLARLAPADGEVLWVVEPPGGLLAGGGIMGSSESAVVTLSPESGTVSAFDPESGDLLWTDPSDRFRTASVGSDHVGILDPEAGTLTIHAATTGDTLWESDSRVTQRAAFGDDYFAFIETRDEEFFLRTMPLP